MTNRLFEPYKCIGLISSTVPHLIRYLEKLNKIQIVTAVGRSFLIFNERLQLIETCVAHDTDITLLASDSKYLFTASANEIFAWKHGHRWKVKCYKNNEKQNTVNHMLVFGGQLLVIDCRENLICWDISTEQITSIIEFNQQKNSTIVITSLLHPATYINKILIGTNEGILQLWNISKSKLIYQFNGYRSAICSLVQTPALHIVAIGHQCGLIVLHHLQQDAMMMKFRQEFGPVTTISFRTDDAATTSIMITGSKYSGHLAIWNLDKQRLEQQWRDLHWQSIASATFIQKQPLMITNSDDNSLKIFAFDDLQTVGRLLYQREGHRLPPTRIKFYDEKFIISAAMDSTLRTFCIHSERFNRSLGLASANRKLAKRRGIQNDSNVLSPIVDFSVETIREKEWDNLVAVHRNQSYCTTWSIDRMCMGKHNKLLHERFNSIKQSIQAECCCISRCGNFVIIGYNTGHLDRFNIQSGIYRGSYCLNNDNEYAHNGPVRSVLCDSLNQMVISGGGVNDCYCRLWRFQSRQQNQLIGSFKLSSSVSRMTIHQDNQFVGIALDDFTVVIIDLDTKRKIRHFQRHTNRINDLLFDLDCRKLFVSSMDSFIYIWDMILAQLIDLIATETPCISLSLSANNEFLSTAHVNSRAIYLWSNISMYSKVTLEPINDLDTTQIKLSQLPSIKSDEIDGENSDDDDDDDDVEIMDTEDVQIVDERKYKSPEQLSKELITLSGMASFRWKNLLQLDLIRKRNKPLDAVQKPMNAPFFLPSISGIEPKFDLSSMDQQDDNDIPNEIQLNHINISPFAQSLQQSFNNNQLQKFFQQQFINVGPSKIDVEIRSIGIDYTDTIDYLLYFLSMIQSIIETNQSFELSMAYLALCIKYHLDTIYKNPRLFDKINEISKLINEKWNRLQRKIDRSISIIEFLRNASI